MTLGLHRPHLTMAQFGWHTNKPSRKTRLILLVSALPSECDTVRVLCLQEGWHLLIASNLEAAIELEKQEDVGVILYDQDALGVDWQVEAEALLAVKPSACLILFSGVANQALRLNVLTFGGYDIVQKPVALSTLKSLVCGYWELLKNLDPSCRTDSARSL